MLNKLHYTELKKSCDIKLIEKYENLQDIDLENIDIIGQERAEEAIKFALNIKDIGYNIYISGDLGSGRTTFAHKLASEIAKNEPIPNDLIYVYNFENPKNPEAIFLKSGGAIKFKNELDDMINDIYINIPKVFSEKQYEDEKEAIFRKYEDKKEIIIRKLTKDAKNEGFGVKSSTNGICFMPIIKESIISEEDYDNLDDDIKEELGEKSKKLHSKSNEILKSIKRIEQLVKEELENIEYNTTVLAIGSMLSNIMEKYKDDEKIMNYLVNLKENIIENIQNFLEEEEEEELSLFPMMTKRSEDEIFEKYRVNIVVDNSKLKNAPVISKCNITYNNLIGEVEFESELGNLITDYMKIKGGILHKANGGYLIINIEDLLKNGHSLEAIIKVLKTGKIEIEQSKENLLGMINVSSIKPEGVCAKFKVIIIGSSNYYDILCEYDEDFKKLFKINIAFDYEMDNNEQNIQKIIKFIRIFEKNKNSLKFDKYAIGSIIEYANRLAGTQNKLTTNFNDVQDILIQSNCWAKLENKEYICKDEIKKAIQKKINFTNIYGQKLEDMMINGDILIDITGSKIGQINGLCVLDFGDYMIGKPNKITVTTYTGKAGIINIEKECKLSGNVHDKGIQVITGYLGMMYAWKFPLTLSCRICFEQNYSGIDGDSASSTELYAIISSLSNMPIRQDIAVTGSVNQFGEIQPIGGVNEKIEGFFDICKKTGLTGKQGVIIPIQNVKDLSLKDEIIDAVKLNKFNIYKIKNIDEGLQILMELEVCEKQKSNYFKKGSIHYKVIKKLQYFYERTNDI